MLDLADSNRFKTSAVLVVDDDPAVVRMIRRLLRDLGFGHVDHATDGPSAVQKLTRGSFDLVISDWNMAPMSGLDLLRQIRGTPSLSKVGFIMVTGNSGSDDVTAAMAAGADGYLLKPFSLANLKKQLTRAELRSR